MKFILKATFTVCLVCRKRKVLLAIKKKGRGKGFLNGYGGHVIGGPDVGSQKIRLEAMRELKEESGLVALKMKKIGFLVLKFSKEGHTFVCHFFRVDEFRGKLKESDEMEMGLWYLMNEKDIPLDKMWEGDRFWMPYFLNKQKFYGYVLYGDMKEKRVIDHFITNRWRFNIDFDYSRC